MEEAELLEAGNNLLEMQLKMQQACRGRFRKMPAIETFWTCGNKFFAFWQAIKYPKTNKNPNEEPGRRQSRAYKLYYKVIRSYFLCPALKDYFRFVASYSLVNYSRIFWGRSLRPNGCGHSWAKEPEKSTTFDL